jgi:hypothetical protein
MNTVRSRPIMINAYNVNITRRPKLYIHEAELWRKEPEPTQEQPEPSLKQLELRSGPLQPLVELPANISKIES